MIDNINSEAIFYSSSYTTKSGWKITLALPDDIAAGQLDAMGAGKRYMLALVPVGDDEQPEPIIKPKGGKLAQRAGIICGRPSFGKWVEKKYGERLVGSEQAAAFIRNRCHIGSRAELDHNEAKGQIFERMLTDYEMWMRGYD
jgi:hypothetical protein